jgi:hypothetical protein
MHILTLQFCTFRGCFALRRPAEFDYDENTNLFISHNSPLTVVNPSAAPLSNDVDYVFLFEDFMSDVLVLDDPERGLFTRIPTSLNRYVDGFQCLPEAIVVEDGAVGIDSTVAYLRVLFSQTEPTGFTPSHETVLLKRAASAHRYLNRPADVHNAFLTSLAEPYYDEGGVELQSIRRALDVKRSRAMLRQTRANVRLGLGRRGLQHV